ncbi:MAG TPA: NAD-dependent epimerase/dehydratase family protein [Longimicrobiales bacterium]|nr:NAD-dependent epimerase/dehydratase family protein [Longimicrobiales bacterium]
MAHNRRDFVRTAAIGAAALGAGALGPSAVAAQARSDTSSYLRPPARRQLRILVLGGTGFIGPHLVRAILARGHTPVLFNRGRTAPQLFVEQYEGIENLVGDRDSDISALGSGRWDAVIDDSGYTPQQVRATAELLRDRVGHYIFTSTRGVYAGFLGDVIDEDAPVGMRGVPDTEWTGYGPLKALAEREVQQVFPGRYMIARPPIITGPGDSTDRFTYWYVRIDRGGDVIAPGDPGDPIQYVDVRDLVDFYVHVAENSVTGTYNVAGPAAPLSSAEFLYGIRAVTPAPVSFTWMDWDFLASHDIREGRELSSWRAPRGENRNYGRVDNSRALAAGMRFRPLADTAGDTLDWWKSLPAERRERMTAGIPADREQAALAAWRAR